MYSKSIIFKQTSVSKFTWLQVHYYSSLPLVALWQSETGHLGDALSCKLASGTEKLTDKVLLPLGMMAGQQVLTDILYFRTAKQEPGSSVLGEGVKNGYAGPSECLIC